MTKLQRIQLIPFCLTPNFFKKIYEYLINKKASIPSKSQEMWLEERDLYRNLSIIVNWENMYCLSSLCTRESKLRAFQFKFLHRKIPSNDFLYKIGIKQTDSCSFCDEQKENPRSSILGLQIHSELLEEHVRVELSKFQRFRKRLSLPVSLFRSHWRRKRPCLSSPTPYS